VSGRRRAAAALLALGAAGLSALSAAAFDVKRLDRSVVRVQHLLLYQGREILGVHGTGFVLNDDGYVVTNHHVIDLAGKLPQGVTPREIFIPDGSWSNRLGAKVVWKSERYDLAILHVPGLKRPPVVLSAVPADTAPEKGEAVYALGFPAAGDSTGSRAALETTFTRGNVSKVAPGRGGTKEGVERPFVQHTAQINPGNSGGPLFNECNEVIAINTFAASSTFKLVRGPNGEMVAHGAAVQGISYSPHVSALIQRLTAEPELARLRFDSTTRPCVRGGGVPAEIYYAIAAVSLVALLSLVLALLRRGGRVESYSQWIRRKTGQAPRAPAALAPAAPAVGPGWRFTGTDGAGRPIEMVVTDHELALAARGGEKGVVVGRSLSLSSKVLADNSVSRRHARIVPEGDGIAVEDLGSTFGVTVDGKPAPYYEAVPIADGSVVTFGDVKLRVRRQ
jgi:hypothetical protein